MTCDQQPASASLRRRTFAAILVICWMGLVVAAKPLAPPTEGLQSPFVTPDITLVYLIAALPVSLMLWRVLRHSLDPLVFSVLTVISHLSAFMVLLLLVAIGVPERVLSHFSWHMGRFVLALLLTTPPAIVWLRRCDPNITLYRNDGAFLAITGIVASLLPTLYVAARCRQDEMTFQELLGQSRIGEASLVAQRLHWLSLRSKLGDQPLARRVADVDRSVRQLQSAVAEPIPSEATDEERLTRARQLAMLGNTREALDTLHAMHTRRPDSGTLAATIHENLGHWQIAFETYARAREDWESLAPSSQRTAGRIQTVTGMAYCLRKQGKYPAAERTYRELLELSPTAHTHFLLAQFYEDTQQTVLARQHAVQAMTMAPEQFERPGKQLLNKLATMHFGCFNGSR